MVSPSSAVVEKVGVIVVGKRALGALGAVAACALMSASPVEAETVTFYLGGTCLCDTVPSEQSVFGLAGGYLSGSASIVGVGYPAGLAFNDDAEVGVANILAHLDQVPVDTKVVFSGTSQGAIVLNALKETLMAVPAAQQRPDGDVSFVTFGDPMNSTGGMTLKVALMQLLVSGQPVATPYHTTEIVREYDGFADWPDEQLPLAVTNALMGILYVHPYYGSEADPALPGTTKTETVNVLGGVTDHYLVLTQQLPLTAPLRSLGIDTTALDATLRPLIDSAYHRAASETDTTETTSTLAPAVATPAETVSTITKPDSVTSGVTATERAVAVPTRTTHSAGGAAAESTPAAKPRPEPTDEAPEPMSNRPPTKADSPSAPEPPAAQSAPGTGLPRHHADLDSSGDDSAPRARTGSDAAAEAHGHGHQPAAAGDTTRAGSSAGAAAPNAQKDS